MSNEDSTSAVRQTDTLDGATDVYDHAIALVDATAPQPDSNGGSNDDSLEPTTSKLTKVQTLTSVKGRLARKKYAKWQEKRQSSKDNEEITEDSGAPKRPGVSRAGSSQRPLTQDADNPAGTETADFAADPEAGTRGLEHYTFEAKRAKQKRQEQPYEVDILYENQRGLFFFGIPLYSHASLLNLDPAPWVTRDLKDSAVNITNAQVPDPSWEWAWKSWYVDMSHDVDEEGWQYSFSFGKRWSWHGTHPWFHSYVRRRRWLRKRVKKHDATGHCKAGSMSAGHVLSGDYFTIHPKRDSSPASTLATTARASLLSQRDGADWDVAPEDVKNVPNLLKALRKATVDREKIDVVRRFVVQGGEELLYLQERIPEIVSFLVFQTSRRQLLELLIHEADEAQKHRDEHNAVDRPEGEAEKRRIDNLLKAVDAANEQIGGLEYWSDRKHVLRTSDESEAANKEVRSVDRVATIPTEDDPVHEIKGISEKAEIEEDPTLHTTMPAMHDEVHTQSSDRYKAGGNDGDKGKDKAVDEVYDHESDEERREKTLKDPPDRMDVDSLMVHDVEQGG